MAKSLESALANWRQELGEDAVVTTTTRLAEAAVATFPTHSKVLAILSPTNREEVQAALRVANRFEIPVYPISRGRNWGLGSRVPPQTSVLLDLSGLNRIHELDESLGFMVIEPGVTFQQAADFLAEQKSKFFLPVIGGSPLGSVIGNVAERGEGVGPYGQRLDFVANLEAILANGDCVHTGFGRFEQSTAQHVHRHGVGPSLESLLTQSNFGVITRMTVWLTPQPHVLRPFVGQILKRDQLARVVDASRDLLLQRVVEPNGIGIWNSIKISSTMGGYPWQAMENQTPLDPQRYPSEPWIIGGAIYSASEAIADATAGHLESQLAPLVDHWQWCEAAIGNNAYTGQPTDQNVRSAYWRKKTGLPQRLDPDADRCGLLWMCFAIPLAGDEIRQVLDGVESIIFRHGFEPNVGFNCVSGRCAHLYLSLIYDRDVDGEDDQAVACHDEVIEALKARGHLPYRLGLLSMSSLPPSDDDCHKWLREIKRTLDPNSILAPGRYDSW